MPAWPKGPYVFAANLLAAAAELNLLQRGGAAALQMRAFKRLTRRLGTVAFWREAGIEPGMRYEAFRARVAPRGHAQLAPAIARMQRGECDVLWPGRCDLFALTPGTAGEKKTLPVTNELLAHFRHAELEALLFHSVRARHAGVFRGRHLHLGGSTPLTPLAGAPAATAFAGDLGAITALNLPAWAERHFFEPGSAIAQLGDWEKKIEAIVARTRGLDVTLLGGLPSWTLVLAAALRDDAARASRRLDHLQSLWPNLECFMHSGVPVGPFQDELRAALGPTVSFHETYVATEGFIAAQDGVPSTGLRLLAHAGLFFEFLPLADFDEARLEHLGPKVVPLAGVKTGVDYALLLTTPAGLARYAIGDVVRFVSTAPPRLLYVGRTKLKLDAFGERVIEKDVTDALVLVCQRYGWRVVNFHVAPLFASNLTGQNRGRQEWWIELRPGNIATPIGPQMATALDFELQQLNPVYAAKRKGGGLDPPFVRLVMPGVFEHWLRYQGMWGGQHKVPRCRSDRVIAEELAQITHFASD
jgi:hypothetical protein